jgi:hypothetical protein
LHFKVLTLNLSSFRLGVRCVQTAADIHTCYCISYQTLISDRRVDLYHIDGLEMIMSGGRDMWTQIGHMASGALLMLLFQQLFTSLTDYRTNSANLTYSAMDFPLHASRPKAGGLVSKFTSSPDYDQSNESMWKLELYSRLDRVQDKCGLLCELNDPELFKPYQLSVPEWPHWKLIHLPDWDTSQCTTFMTMVEADASDGKFPKKIPDELYPFFSMNGTVSMSYYRKDGDVLKRNYLDARTVPWSGELVDGLILKAIDGTLIGYTTDSAKIIRSMLATLPIAGARVLVIGSQSPWLEAICLSLGASEVTTLEYTEIKSDHPKVKALTPSALRMQYASGGLQPFDIIATHSSIEHSGLGRYRDALNPWGDLLATARAWCLTKPGGYMYLGLPSGSDGIQYNAGRTYGVIRWPLITSNWKPVQFTVVLNETEFKPWPLQRGVGGGHGMLFQKPF